jgi:hypothetical protein
MPVRQAYAAIPFQVMLHLTGKLKALASLFAIALLTACVAEVSTHETAVQVPPGVVPVESTAAASDEVNASPVSDSQNPAPTSLLSTPASPDPVATPLRRPTQFVPLDDPVFVLADQRTDLPDSAFVLGLDLFGEQRAYPLQMMAYHHIVNDTVGGNPTLITY